ncbi:hypothetical protein LINPERPRIM_LOCUS40063 [Linum perenne]
MEMMIVRGVVIILLAVAFVPIWADERNDASAATGSFNSTERFVVNGSEVFVGETELTNDVGSPEGLANVNHAGNGGGGGGGGGNGGGSGWGGGGNGCWIWGCGGDHPKNTIRG